MTMGRVDIIKNNNTKEISVYDCKTVILPNCCIVMRIKKSKFIQPIYKEIIDTNNK